MSLSKEISILKLVIDLIKVDNSIHKEEIFWIERLMSRYRYSEDDLKTVHNITLHEAIGSLQTLNTTHRNEVIELLKEIIASDNDIALCERILLSSIQLALQEDTHDKVQILTVDALNFDGYDNQLIYLEKEDCAPVKNTIQHNYETNSRLLKSLGIDFFFYPHVAHVLLHSHSYITPTIELLFPTFSHINEGDKTGLIRDIKTTDLYSYIHKSMCIDDDAIRFKSFLMMKIQNSKHNGQPTVDFMCIDCSDDVQKIINLIIANLTIETTQNSIPYEGCYRTFFEMMSEKSKQNYPLLLSGYSYYLQGKNNIALEIRGSERKTLFTLFLLYGNKGISNATFASLTKDSPLGKEVITIYRYFANEKSYELVENALQSDEEPPVITNLRDISKRNSHIGFIKRAFTAITSLKNAELYYPQNIKGELSYNIGLEPDMIKAQHYSDESESALSISFFL